MSMPRAVAGLRRALATVLLLVLLHCLRSRRRSCIFPDLPALERLATSHCRDLLGSREHIERVPVPVLDSPCLVITCGDGNAVSATAPCPILPHKLFQARGHRQFSSAPHPVAGRDPNLLCSRSFDARRPSRRRRPRQGLGPWLQIRKPVTAAPAGQGVQVRSQEWLATGLKLHRCPKPPRALEFTAYALAECGLS